MRDLALNDPRGLFLRREALAYGYCDNDLRDMLRQGVIARIRHGAYTAASTWSAADHLEQHRLRCLAVLATHSAPVALSHTSAAVMQGLDVWSADLSKVHVTRLDGRTERLARDVVYHRGRVRDEELEPLDSGGLMTIPARASLEHSSIVGIESGLVTLDSFLRSTGPAGLDLLATARQDLLGWPGVRRLQITLRLARHGSESVGETRLRFLCWEHHLPEPELQFEIRDDTGAVFARTDFAWRKNRVFGEFDGKVKYDKYLRPGESASDALFREKRREDRIREHTGYAVIRFTWSDLSSRPATATRLRRMLDLG